ncbi:MAG: hypothetical protein A2939_03500 [Parcubacteria group bacterium RIFCSPLOWO2_01_FULL_48_18]|nr:MAG: hypothetical protein A2939_03500 [Parcubacteria group bacterium RIFCSPLOWO2_01_FULL_48_18]OHB23116.1 MAG: hypothetical protein A3J67_03125 [Parcubacteria group bacterium RIFCSPHIGHO2_02_FULL_48_10b]
MKSAFATLVIGAFLAVTIFGVFAMNHGSGHSHNGCIAAIVQGVDCPKEDNALSSIAFHINAFRGFSTATFNDNLASALLLFIALALTIVIGVIASVHPAQPICAANCHRGRFLKLYSFPLQQELVHWLTLHENSPSLV